MAKIGKMGGLLAATALAVGLGVALPGTASAGTVTCIDGAGMSWGTGTLANATIGSTHLLTIDTGMPAPLDIPPNSLLTTVRADYSSGSAGGPWITDGVAYAGASNAEFYSGDYITVGPLAQSGTAHTSGFARWDSSIPLSATSWHFKIRVGSWPFGPLWMYCRANTTTVWAV